MPLTVLFCADPFDPRRADPHFAREAASVRAIYGEAPLIDHDALQRGDLAEAVRRVPRDLGPAWYRGWMVTAGQYEQLAAALDDKGTPLITLPADYRRAHELPGWHDTFAGLTPSSVWLPLAPGDDPDEEVLVDLVRELPDGAAVVKDYVKSRKHEWDEACFVPDLRDAGDLHRVITRMIELQDDFLAGGIVVRAFEPYLGPEARVWWVDGEPVLTGPHPDTPESRPEPVLDDVRAAIRSLGCRFVTTDLALRDDEVWRVIEVGDGQVSDLASSEDPIELYEQLPGGALS